MIERGTNSAAPGKVTGKAAYNDARGSPAPNYSEWQRLWQLWDAVTLDMIPAGSHTAQPLALRHPFIFYTGHLPAFTDARLSRVLQQALTEPKGFAVIFARGIDPDLDDPSKCHDHSPVPDQWPTVDEILQYRDRVRSRIALIYTQYSKTTSAAAGGNGAYPSVVQSAAAARMAAASGGAAVAAMPAELQHVLWMCYEHEAMHLETLLYMMVQFDGTLPPPAHVLKYADPVAAAGDHTHHNSVLSRGSSSSSMKPDQPELSAAAAAGDRCVGKAQLLPPPAKWVQLNSSPVVLGFNPEHQCIKQTAAAAAAVQAPEGTAHIPLVGNAPAGPSDYTEQSVAQKTPLRFGWDNEMPARSKAVSSCLMQHRPVCLLEYVSFLAHQLAAATAAGAHAGSSTSGSAADSSSNQPSMVLQLLGPDGALRHLLPLSLHINADVAESAHIVAAAVPADSIKAAAAAATHCTGGSSNNESDAAAAAALEDQLFALLQQLLSVKSVFGLISISTAGLWPVYCSALQACAYAAWWDGGSCRLPTEEELLLGGQYNADLAAQQYKTEANLALGNLQLDNINTADVPADNATCSCRQTTCKSNGHLAGVVKSADFNVWHPVDVQVVPVTVRMPAMSQHLSERFGAVTASDLRKDAAGTSNGSSAASTEAVLLSQLQDNGWEWTSTVFDSHPGFKPHPLYSEYSADFFDGKHYVLLGGSWATISSIANRGSFRNWYQAGQEHVFAKFRLCKDAGGTTT